MSDQLTHEIADFHDVLLLLLPSAPVFGVLLIFLGAIFLAVFASSLAQVGIGFSWKPLIPKWQRIDPITGVQRIFGMRGLVRTLLSTAKLTVIMLVAWKLIAGDLHRQVLLETDLHARLARESHQLLLLGFAMAVCFAIIAAIDYSYQRWQHHRDLMMTKQEVKEEYKQSEGDPVMKGKIRQIQREMAQRRMMQEVPKADVVITNPTHVAVALRYDRAKMAAPVVVAKGYDLVAQRIKKLAAEAGVTQVENIDLARALAKKVKVGRAIPVDFYHPVAEILGRVFKVKKRTSPQK